MATGKLGCGAPARVYTGGVRLLPANSGLGWTPYAWLIYSLPFPFLAFLPGLAPVVRAATVAAYPVFLCLYFAGYWRRGRELVPILVALNALGFAFAPVNFVAPAFFIYSAAFMAFLGSPRATLLGLALQNLAVVAYGLALHMPIGFYMPAVVIATLIGGVNIHFAQARATNARLHLAQDEIERLAKLAERERIARDLHDLLGHTLSVVVLKSELASKLLARDPSRAAAEIREVETVARQALAQVRSAVAGYRSSGLSGELQAMARAFESAGIQLAMEADPFPLTPARETALALALREGATNVIRHARARRCHVRLSQDEGQARLEIEDDGRGGEEPEGNGLRGMRERLATLGGRLVRDGRQGTRLTITLPLEDAAAGGTA